VGAGLPEGVAQDLKRRCLPEGVAQVLKRRCLPEGVAQDSVLLYRRLLVCRSSDLTSIDWHSHRSATWNPAIQQWL